MPHSLQEILAGVFVGVEDFDVLLTRVHGVAYSYLKARDPVSRAGRDHGRYGVLYGTPPPSAAMPLKGVGFACST